MNPAASPDLRRQPGIGLCYQQELHEFIDAQAASLDFLEIVPDTAWTDHGRGQIRQYVDDREMLAFFRAFRRERDIVSHSIGLSIGSAHRFRDEHLAQIARWHADLDFAWHSDHLAFNLVTDTAGSEYLLGVPFPVTRDGQMLDLLTARIAEVRRRIDLLFLLENNVNYIGDAAAEFDEPRFLNELCVRTKCGLLLDLHNVYVDVCNGSADWDSYLSAIDLDNVHEIHLAGGLELNGVYLDAHSGAVPDIVWRIAAEVVPRCRNLRGITFELLGSWYNKMGPAALLETIARMRDLAGTAQ
jgi:uncharacterized protein (UPF0276 family)